jgi:hypothetical protein
MTQPTATAIKERPILFSGPMVRAILEGRKTQTRRTLKAKDSDPTRCITMPTLMENIGEWREQDGRWFGIDGYETLVYTVCPYGQVGDRLWVRENFAIVPKPGKEDRPRIKIGPDGTGITWQADWQGNPSGFKWKPSIHMPRWASRITLEITGVRVERLTDISEADAIAEGVQCAGVPASLTNRGAFGKLWQSINGPNSWSANPWVWVIEFRKLESAQ